MSRQRVKTPTEDPRAQIAAVVAHQLRNRLSRVVFGVEALTRAISPESAVGTAASRVRRGVDELVIWFDQLIELVRVMSGSAELRAERIDLAAVVSASVDRIRPVVEARQQVLRMNLPSEPVWVDGDALGLDVAISNLLTNAAKFTPTGGSIEVTLAVDPTTARVIVRDDGIGIPASRLPHLFDPFGADHNAPGTPSGIRAGLFLARSLVSLHQGKLVARSEGDGRGSEFTITLPRAKGEAPPADPAGTMRAVVVSGQRGESGMLAALLRSWGYHVRTATDAASAQEIVERFAPSVVLIAERLSRESDHLLPLRLREASPVAGARYVLIGGERVQEGATPVGGVDARLPDPIDPDLLHATLRRG